VSEHFGRGVPVKEYFWTGPYPKRLHVLDPAAYKAGNAGVEQRPSTRDTGGRPKAPRPRPDVDDFKW
jgi:hypothetical protein